MCTSAQASNLEKVKALAALPGKEGKLMKKGQGGRFGRHRWVEFEFRLEPPTWGGGGGGGGGGGDPTTESYTNPVLRWWKKGTKPEKMLTTCVYEGELELTAGHSVELGLAEDKKEKYASEGFEIQALEGQGGAGRGAGVLQSMQLRAAHGALERRNWVTAVEEAIAAAVAAAEGEDGDGDGGGDGNGGDEQQ